MKFIRSHKPRRTKATRTDAATGDELIVPNDDQSISFVNALVARGQAARANPDGSLEPGVTHEIVGETEKGLPILRRRRVA
jgi:hypothetical protein